MFGNPAKIEAADVVEERIRIRQRLSELASPRAQLDHCFSLAFEDRAGAEGLLTRFLHAHEALRLHADHDLLTKGETEKLVQMAHKLLQIARIKPQSSRLAFLYAELYETQAEIHGSNGDRWRQLWDYHKAQLLSRRAPRHARADQLIATAAGLFREGNGQVAYDLVTEAGAVFESEAPAWLVSLYRLRGHFAEARRLLPRDDAWGHAWTDAMERRDPQPLVQLSRRERGGWAGSIDLWLWTRAVAQTKVMDEAGLPSVRQLKKQAAADGPVDEPAFAAAALLESLYDPERPLDQRVEASRDVLDLAARVKTVERGLLCLAALCRWLFRFNQMDLAICVLSTYRERARAASAGVGDDPFQALADLSVATLAGRYRRAGVSVAAERDFEVRRGTRLLDLGKLATRVSSLMMKGTLRGWLTTGDSKAQIKVRTETEIAQTVVSFLTRRKGAFLKIGQICSYFDGPIARHVTDQYRVLQAEVAAMPPAMMRRVFVRELGRTPEEAFQSFDELPFAAGSIGQVHRAVTKDGRRVAVKIRYENVRELIEVEMQTIRLGRPIFLRMLPALNWDEIMDEIGSHLIAETDYERERRNLEYFGAQFQDDPDVMIPRVLPEFSSAGVLTTDLVEGQAFDEFLGGASQEERDKAAGTIARVLLTCNYKLRRFNADPQPGNFLFDDGKVGFIDFGCVKEFPKEYFEQRTLCNRAFFRKDLEAIGRHYVGQGYVDDLEGIDLEDLWRMYKAVNAYAMKDEPFEVTPGYGMNIFQHWSVENRHHAKFRLPVHSFFSSRIEFGMMSVLHRLGARVNYHRIVMPLLFPDGDAPPPLDEESAA